MVVCIEFGWWRWWCIKFLQEQSLFFYCTCVTLNESLPVSRFCCLCIISSHWSTAAADATAVKRLSALMFAELLSAPELMYSCILPPVTLYSSSLWTHGQTLHSHRLLLHRLIMWSLPWSSWKPSTVTVIMWSCSSLVIMVTVTYVLIVLNVFLSLWRKCAWAVNGWCVYAFIKW